MASGAQEQQQATLQKFYSGLERQQAAAAAAGISAPNAERLIAQGDAQIIGGDILAYDGNLVDARRAYTDAYDSYAAAIADANGARA
ncbi:MAG: hypothetical protein ACRDNS_08520, partial [Trebonia sp.]